MSSSALNHFESGAHSSENHFRVTEVTRRGDGVHIVWIGEIGNCEESTCNTCVLDWTLVRRTLIFALALSLVGLGIGPLSACALFSSQPAECATPNTQSQCAKMNMGESGTQLIPAPDTSCCSISQAPISQSQFKGSDLSLAAPVTVLDAMGDVPFVRPMRAVAVVQDLSPPPLQSLLCTFLI